MRRHHRAERFKGVVAIGPYSGLRKLMRAARRGKIPDERVVVIKVAMEKAAKRTRVG